MIRSHLMWLVPIAAAIGSFALDTTRVMAQTIYPFEATYNSENTLVPITNNVSKVTIIASSTDAPYGLTSFFNTNYGLIDSAKGTITFKANPADFGLETLPIGGVTFVGTGSDRLFGTIDGKAQLDFKNLVGTATGTFNITGGSGKFNGATGIFSFIEKDLLNPDPTAPFKSQAVLSGSFQTPQMVTEPANTTALIGMGIFGVSLLRRQRKQKVAV